MIIASTPNQIAVFQALTIRKALQLYIKTGMHVNRAYTPKLMLATASRITGRTFKAREYQRAVDCLTAWIDANWEQ